MSKIYKPKFAIDMKSYVFLTILAVVSLSKANSVVRQKMFEHMVNKCATKEEATSDDVVEMINREMPTTRAGQCLHACLMETIGLIRDGKASVEGSLALADASGAEPSRIATAKEMVEECSSVSDADRCMLAQKIIECTVKTATARGLDPKHLLE